MPGPQRPDELPVMRDYRLSGWRVRSAIPLPDLTPWTEPALAAVDVTIDLGTVPALTEALLQDGPVLQVGQSGTCRFAVPGVAAYRIDPAGQRITIAADLPPTDPAVRAFLLGTVFAIVCQRRGLTPLHACCVQLATPTGPVAIAFAAASGVGKSTLAAEFRAQGCPLLADDVTVLDQEGRAIPTFPRVKLWEDSLQHFGEPTEALERVRGGMAKFSLPLRQEFAEAPLPLMAVYHLTRVTDSQQARQEQLRGLAATLPFLRAVYQDRALMQACLDRTRFAADLTAAAARVPSHWTLAEPLGFERLRALVARLRADYAAPSPP